MMNRDMVKEAMMETLFFRMLKGEIIIIEYENESKKNEVRKYFPDFMIHMFDSDEVIEIIKWAMGYIHKELSEAGKGEVIYVWIRDLKRINYGMAIY